MFRTKTPSVTSQDVEEEFQRGKLEQEELDRSIGKSSLLLERSASTREMNSEESKTECPSQKFGRRHFPQDVSYRTPTTPYAASVRQKQISD